MINSSIETRTKLRNQQGILWYGNEKNEACNALFVTPHNNGPGYLPLRLKDNASECNENQLQDAYFYLEKVLQNFHAIVMRVMKGMHRLQALFSALLFHDTLISVFTDA